MFNLNRKIECPCENFSYTIDELGARGLIHFVKIIFRYVIRLVAL